MSASPLAASDAEYWYHVSPQRELPIAGSIDLDFSVERVKACLDALATKPSDKAARQFLSNELVAAPSLFNDLRQLLGLTDKRSYLELSYIASRHPHPSEKVGLCGCHPWAMARHTMSFFLNMLKSKDKAVRAASAAMMAEFLMNERLRATAVGYSKVTAAQLRMVYETLIVAREIQQKAAKRRGHGCEAALAKVIQQFDVGFLPKEKAENPFAADRNLDANTLEVVPKETGETYSFDLLLLDGSNVRVAIQSLIHTSDPGQYGVNKSNETVDVARRIAQHNKRQPGRPIELWGMLDGVGFSENKEDTLNKMLRAFRFFVQFNTLYKAPLRLHELGLTQVRAIRFGKQYSAADKKAMADKYVPKGVRILRTEDGEPPRLRGVRAGWATVYR